MELLERDDHIRRLESAFDGISGAGGTIVSISGEAGIGKTSLVEQFTGKIKDKANVLWGACDALFTPRPLGPLYDISFQLKNSLLDLLKNQSSRALIFSKFLEELRDGSLPRVVVIEDVHWADESTLDLIKFLARRANRINSLFIITFRSDEIGRSHPLRFVLGDIPPKNLLRLDLAPLTAETVYRIAESSGISNLFEITAGNPFLINELLSDHSGSVPTSVKDSIMRKLAGLSDNARELVELVSVVPTRAERWLIDGAMPAGPGAIDEVTGSGVLKIEDGSVSFKHELSRMAAEESLSESRRESLNELVVRSLLKQERFDNYLGRIIHHAVRARDAEIIVRYAPDAAKQASALGAHSLASDHFQNALRYADNLPREKLIGLYEGKSYECYLTGKVSEGIEAGETVLRLLKEAPDPAREGENFRRLSRMLWYDGQDRKGEEYLDNAIGILGKLPMSSHLAMAYSNKSQIYMSREDNEPAIEWGEKAVGLARQLGDPEVEAHALNNIGCARVFMDDYSGEACLKESLEISIRNNFYEHAARAYANLGSILLQGRKLVEADECLSAGRDYSNEKDLYTLSLCLAGHHAVVKMQFGNWDEAVDTSNMVLGKHNVPPANRTAPLFVVGLVRARRNDPGADEPLEEAGRLAVQVNEMEKTIFVITARAEISWLQNRIDDAVTGLKALYDKLKRGGNSWEIGQLAYWLWKAGHLSEIPQRIAKPYLLQINGEWQAAAALWEELRCPYEQALALSEGNERGMKKAIEIFDRLGASAASQLIKQQMRGLGIKRVPKGPRHTTRANPAGLTSRQLEILRLLDDGLSNNEIGNRLFISPKTVDHHISAILSKLNVKSRHEAAALVRAGLSTTK